MQFFHTTVSEEAIARVSEVLRSGFLNEGQSVREFEAALREWTGAPEVLAVNSCTSALTLCLLHLGVGRGDEVIVPPQTFIASGLVVLHAGATPVFADIDPETANISPASVRAKITPRTKAIIAVHWGGAPCDMDALNAISDETGVPLIEDAAHAFGARYKGKPIGAVSRFTCFSFQAIKGLTTGDGGAIACRDGADVKSLQKLRWFGIDKTVTNVSAIGERITNVDVAGFKNNMNNISAAIGLGNLPSYRARLARRAEIAARYREAFRGINGVRLLRLEEGAESSWWLFTLRVDRREDFARAITSRDVPVTVVDRRIDRHSVFGGERADLTGAALLDAEQIAVPLHEGLSEEDVAHVIAAVKAGW